MKNKKIQILIIFAFFLTVSFGIASGGQVVTDETRAWAKQALEQEESLKALVASNAVGVLYFSNLTRQPDLDPLQKGIAVMLITDLSKVNGLTVVERIRLQALVQEMKIGTSGLVDEKTAPNVGKLLGAHWLVGGNLLSGKANLLQIKSNVLDVPTTQISGQPGADGMLADLILMEKNLVFETIKFLKIEPTPQEQLELKKPISTNVKALMNFFKCIDESDRENYKEAAGFCKAALAADPGLVLAQQTLTELSDLGLISGMTAAAAAANPVAATVVGVTAGVAAIVVPVSIIGPPGSEEQPKPVSPQ